MRFTPNLAFRGQCETAFRFYERCFGGTVAYMASYADSPMAEHVPLEWRGKIMHATLTVGDSALTGSDPVPEQYERPKGFVILIGLDDTAIAERVFQALAENGTIQMPLQQTFWAARFGVVTDQFGIPWAINCEPQSPRRTKK